MERIDISKLIDLDISEILKVKKHLFMSVNNSDIIADNFLSIKDCFLESDKVIRNENSNAILEFNVNYKKNNLDYLISYIKAKDIEKFIIQKGEESFTLYNLGSNVRVNYLSAAKTNYSQLRITMLKSMDSQKKIEITSRKLDEIKSVDIEGDSFMRQVSDFKEITEFTDMLLLSNDFCFDIKHVTVTDFFNLFIRYIKQSK